MGLDGQKGGVRGVGGIPSIQKNPSLLGRSRLDRWRPSFSRYGSSRSLSCRTTNPLPRIALPRSSLALNRARFYWRRQVRTRSDIAALHRGSCVSQERIENKRSSGNLSAPGTWNFLRLP